RGPAFPVAEQVEKILAPVTAVQAQEPRRRRRRAGARIEHRDAHFPPGARLRDQGDVADHERQAREAHCGQTAVPLMYRSTTNPEPPCGSCNCDPRPQWRSAKETIRPSAHSAMSRIRERSEERR